MRRSNNFVSILVISFFILLNTEAKAQSFSIPSDRVLLITELDQVLLPEVKQDPSFVAGVNESTLAAYFRNKFSERYFYNWESFEQRFALYNSLYKPEKTHLNRAEDHMSKYEDSTQWVLPFNYLNGDPVNAYALRHLARQHKMVDIGLRYFYDDKNPMYIDYFVNQMNSLNIALEKGEYEKIEDGNGVYEVFRSGYRILNWLRIHNMFLGEEPYSDADQLNTIATILQHGQDLYERNANFRPGNHQTRGMSALAQLAILLRDFEGTDLWYERAMTRLDEHLNKEINSDGFQFERSVHYHISDIGNYFYVYQLAKISNMAVDKAWEEKLESLFTTLTMIAYPDKTAPVLQDDTDTPWAEYNDIAATMSLGYLLFNNPEYGYFADKKVERDMYWFLQGRQVEMLSDIEKKKPRMKSLSFNKTGYYIMREGWNKKNRMMILSAGLDPDKPDHQHGDMLGVQAYANGHILLPNYQVRYSLPDYEFFKNSMVKNVALVDELMQGRKYKGNKGGSGFGKFGYLPNPNTILWDPTKGREWYLGSHDGFEEAGVSYSRQVFSVGKDFWIVKDNFKSTSTHDYKQVWQGHYTANEEKTLIRSTFNDGSGFDIYQLADSDEIIKDGTQGKEWSVFVTKDKTEFSYITVLYPFSSYDKGLNPTDKSFNISGWEVDKSGSVASGANLRAISNQGKHYLFNVEEIRLNDEVFSFEKPVDLYFSEAEMEVHLLEDDAETVQAKGKKKFKINNEIIKKSTVMKPGDILTTISK